MEPISTASGPRCSMNPASYLGRKGGGRVLIGISGLGFKPSALARVFVLTFPCTEAKAWSWVPEISYPVLLWGKFPSRPIRSQPDTGLKTNPKSGPVGASRMPPHFSRMCNDAPCGHTPTPYRARGGLGHRAPLVASPCSSAAKGAWFQRTVPTHSVRQQASLTPRSPIYTHSN